MASERSAASKAIGILLGMAVLGGVLWWKFSMAEEQSADVRRQISAELAGLPDYAERGELYQELLATHHDPAFDAHHSMGSRRTDARFDGEAYMDDLFVAMIADAESRGEEECATMLRALRADLVWDQP